MKSRFFLVFPLIALLGTLVVQAMDSTAVATTIVQSGRAGDAFEYQSFLFSPVFWLFAFSIPVIGISAFSGILFWNRALAKKVRVRTQELTETVALLETQIQERQDAEAALATSEFQYRATVDSIHDAIYAVDLECTIRLVNKTFERFVFDLGCSGDVVGKNFQDCLPLIDPQLELEVKEVFATGNSIEAEHVIHSGKRDIIADVHRIAVRGVDGQIQYVVSVLRDITVGKHMQEALKESERRYRFLFDESPACSVIIDTNGLIRDMNRSFQVNLGYSPEEVIGKPALDFVAKDDRARVAEGLAERFKGNFIPEEVDTAIAAKDGSIHYVSFARGQSLLFKGDIVDGLLITGIDVTERRKSLELARQQEQKLIQADKMATLGILVSGVAHEVNNPNNFIILNSDNLSDIWKDIRPLLERYREEHGEFLLAGLKYSEIRDEVAVLIQGISDGAKRIRNIVQNLKDFSRQETSDLNQLVQVNSALGAANTILGNLIKKTTDHYSISQGADIPPVKGAFQKIEQVIINLITNACQALPDRGRAVYVTTGFDPKTSRVFITVKDEGTGISPENLKQIMNPFFTTKRDTGGTGLGLSISYSIVKDHGGELSIASAVGKGTIVTVSLPASI